MFKRGLILILGLCALTMADTWSFYGGPWCAKKLVDIAVGLNDGQVVIYGVNFDYSLVKSTDEGQTWIELLQGVPLPDRTVRCVACDPNNADLVYIGLPKGQGRLFEGIQYSTDGGNNWVERDLGLPASFVPSALAMCDAQHIVLGMEPQSASEHTIYYWNGAQWTQSTFPSPNYKGFRVTDLKWDPRSEYPWIIYASSDKVAPGGNHNYIGVYQSTDYGHTWVQIGHPDPSQPSGYMERPEVLAVCCALNGYVFAGYRPEQPVHTDGGVMRTTDGGITWTRVLNMDNFPVNDVIGDPINPQKVYAAFGCSDYSYEGKGVYRNTNAGELGLWGPFNEDLTDLYTNVLVTFKVNAQNFLFLGTDNSFFIRNLTTPTNWFERNKGMHKPKVIAVEPRIPNFFSFSDKANYASENNGIDWSTRSTVARVSENLSAEVHPSLNNEMLKWTRVFLPGIEYDLYYSDNGGSNWNTVYREMNDVIPPIPNIELCYSLPSRAYTFSNHSENYGRFILRSEDGGNTWAEYPTDLVMAKISSVTCDRTVDGMNHIFITGIPFPGLIHESTDGGTSWNYKTPPVEFGWGMVLFGPMSSDKLLVELAGSESSPPFWLKTTNRGDDWQVISNFPNHCPGVFTIDPEEPSLIYTAPFNPTTNFSDFYFSVDYCHIWIQDDRGLPPTRIWDLEVDPNSPQYLYAGTDSGVYYWTPPFINKHLVSSSYEATFANNGRKLLHVYATDELWVCYESGGVISAVHSTDAGVTWSRKMELGEGKYPAVAIRDVPDYQPCIVWLKTTLRIQSILPNILVVKNGRCLCRLLFRLRALILDHHHL